MHSVFFFDNIDASSCLWNSWACFFDESYNSSSALKGELWLPVPQREPHKSQDRSFKTNLTMADKAKAEEQPEF